MKSKRILIRVRLNITHKRDIEKEIRKLSEVITLVYGPKITLKHKIVNEKIIF